MSTSGHRVAFNLVQAGELVREYRSAAGAVGGASVALLPLLREAGELLNTPTDSAATRLEGTAIELAYDADDLAWRIDYIAGTDARFDARLMRFGYVPDALGGPPTWSAEELAERFVELLERASVFDAEDIGTLLNALKQYTRRDHGDPEWDEILDYFEEDLPDDDSRLARQLHDVLEDLDDVDGLRLADVEVLLAELAGQLHDPDYLAEFFAELGPANTLGLTEMIGTLGYAEALRSGGDRVDYSADPIELRDMLSDALGVASQATHSARHHGTAVSLSSHWFDELFELGVTKENIWFGRDPIYVHDGLPTLFATGLFRDDVARRAGELALDIFDHNVDVRRGQASPLYEGFDILETHWEDRGGLLLGAATRYPEVAARLLLHESATGRTGAEIVTDRSFDNMNREVVATHYAAFVRAGTIGAEDLALAGGATPRAVALLEDPWHAKAALFEAIAAQAENETKHDPYPASLNAAFSDVVIHTMPHFMHVPPHQSSGVDVYVDIDGDLGVTDRIPSGEFGISTPPYTAKYLFGALFRSEADRSRITDAAVLEQRRAYHVDSGLLTFEMVGRLEGALANGFIVAGMDDANAFAREIEASNERIDSIWDASGFVLDLIPGTKVIATSAEGIDHMLSVAGIDIREELWHGDSDDPLVDARNAGQREAFDVDLRARDFVFSRAYDELVIEYAGGGVAELSDRSRAIFDAMSADTQLSRLIDPDRLRISLPNPGNVNQKVEYDSMAWHFTRTDPELDSRFRRFAVGVEDTHLEYALD